MNTFYKDRPSHKWTWYRWNEALQQYTDKSMIDLYITNNKNLFNDAKSVPSISLDSDHRLVLAKIKIVKPRERAKKKTKRLKIEELKNDDAKERLREKIAVKIAEKRQEPSNGEQSVGEEWKLLKGSIIEAAEETIGYKVQGGTKKKRTAWWNDEVKEAVTKNMKAFRKWMRMNIEKCDK